MSDTEEQESILNNLSKTRQLWSSKADVGTPNYLIPKTPASPSSTVVSKHQIPNGNPPVATEVVRADEQLEEDYALPDIKAMRSQWEVSNETTAPVPMPSAKSHAAIAREKSMKREQAPPPEPVNRVEPAPEEETYDVELNKLKAQFESAAKAASKTRPKSPKTVSNAAIKEQVNKKPPTRQQSSGNTNKKIRLSYRSPSLSLGRVKSTSLSFGSRFSTSRHRARFEDEMTASNEQYVTEQRTETEILEVNLSGLKYQFESRKDEQLVTPQIYSKKSQPSRTGYNRISSTSRQQEPTVEIDGSSHDNQIVTPRDEPVKSSEPVFDEMIGEESVKDRLKRFKQMAETTQTSKSVVVNKAPPKRELTPILKRESESNESKVSDDLEVVRSPPAGTRETVDYIPSVDLRQTKALFETSQPKASRRTLSSKRSSRSSSTSSPSQRGRSSSSSSGRDSRSSSRQSATSSSRSSSCKRSKSPAAPLSARSSTSGAHSEQSMAEVVKPPPAGTKETPDYVPSVKVSSMKSMFESSSTSPPPLPVSPPRRQSQKDSWTSPQRKEEKKEETVENTVAEDDKEVVRPSSAGTKEMPDYTFSVSDLKSRAAIFNAPPPEQYTPRNKVNTKQVNVPREIVNAQQEQNETDYELAQSLKDTKKMFEQGGTVVTPTSPQTRQQFDSPRSPPPAADVVRPPPAGTRDIDIVPAADLWSMKSRFENPQEVAAEPTSSRKKPIDIKMEAAEAQRREKEIAARPVVAVEVQEKKEDKPEPEVQEPEPIVHESVVEQQNVVIEVQKQSEPEPKEPELEPRHLEVMDVQEQSKPKQVEPEPRHPAPKPRHVEQVVAEQEPEPKIEEQETSDEEQEMAEEEVKQDSDSDSEGEYIIQKEQEVVIQTSDNDVAAAVVPVRVALPDASKNSSSSSSASDLEDRDSLDEAPVNHSKSSSADSSDSLEVEASKPKYEIAEVQQEDTGTSLPDASDQENEDDFDKPHFHYDYDENDSARAPETNSSDSLLIVGDNSGAQTVDLLAASSNDLLGNGGALLVTSTSSVNQTSQINTDLLFGGSSSEPGDILLLDPLTSDPPPQFTEAPSNSVDLLNGFGDIEPSKPQKVDSSAKTAPANADPFDIFGSAPMTSEPSKENSAKDPFDLFSQ